MESTEHTVGDIECCGWGGPQPCGDGCPGLVHIEFLDESYDSLIMTYRCDVCDDNSPFN